MTDDTPPQPVIVFDADNPEWTEADFAQARPGAEVLPAEVLRAFGRNPGGRPRLAPEVKKRRVTLMLDPDVLGAFKADGRGWQTRVNAALRAAKGLLP
jgi:uncharacterized protein (DUF4415 family)